MAGSNPMGENGKVTYSVKELLAEIHDDVKEIKGKLDTKADKADLADIRRMVDELEQRVRIVETQETRSTAISTDRKWLIGIAATVFAALVGVWVNALTHFVNFGWWVK